MNFCIGLAVGFGVAWLMGRLKTGRRQVQRVAVQQRRQHEYHNFLHYNGEQQEDYHGND